MSRGKPSRAASGLRRLEPARARGAAITIELDGAPVRAYEGEPIAVALFAEGVRLLSRSPKYHRPRGLFCGTGHCGSCLMRIDGRPNVRACLVPATTGIRCERQNAFPDADADLLAAADWMFPGGMDHHRLMTGSRLGNELFVKLVRRMGGTGTLPDLPAPPGAVTRDEPVDVCVVGGGPAGLTAARVVAQARPGVRVLLLDDQDVPGGSLLAEPDGWARAAPLVDGARAAGVRIVSRANAIGVYIDAPNTTPAALAAKDAAASGADTDPAPGLLAAVTPTGLLRITARRFLYATGAYEQNLPVGDADRPGFLAARAVGRLAFLWGIAPTGRVMLFSAPTAAPPESDGDGPRAFAGYLARLTAGLQSRGVDVSCVTATDAPKIHRSELIAAGATPAPASELARQHGAAVTLDEGRGGFAVVTNSSGRCAPGIFCAGDVTGYLGPDAAAHAGAHVGAALAQGL